MIIVNNDERLIVIGEFKLLPGCNDVNNEKWEEITKKEVYKGNPLYNVSSLLKDEILQEINEEFNKLDLNTKEKILNGTFNLKTLEYWKNNESNDSIRGQIVDRIKGIKNAEIKVVYGDPNKKK